MAVGSMNLSSTVSTIEGKLKLLEESRLKSFNQWKFDQNEKCSASEVKLLIILNSFANYEH